MALVLEARAALGAVRMALRATDRTLNMKTTIKGAFAARRPGISTAKGRKSKTTLDSKRGPKGFYKGNRVGATGRRTALGAFIKEESRTPDIVTPANLATTDLRPYVAQSVRKIRLREPHPADFMHESDKKPLSEDADVAAALAEIRAAKGDEFVAAFLAKHAALVHHAGVISIAPAVPVLPSAPETVKSA